MYRGTYTFVKSSLMYILTSMPPQCPIWVQIELLINWTVKPNLYCLSFWPFSLENLNLGRVTTGRFNITRFWIFRQKSRHFTPIKILDGTSLTTPNFLPYRVSLRMSNNCQRGTKEGGGGLSQQNSQLTQLQGIPLI